MTPGIPAQLGEIEPDWLNRVLPDLAEGTSVVTCKVEEIGAGLGFTGQIGRVHLTYTVDGARPTSVIVKLPSTKQQVSDWYWQGGQNIYSNEIAFYREIATTVDLRIPEAYYGDVDFDARRAILLLEDLSPASSGDQIGGCSPEEARDVVSAMAGFHTTYWESPRLDKLDWLWPYAGKGYALRHERYQAAYPDFVNHFSDVGSRALEIAEWLTTRGYDLREAVGRRPRTIVHGDLRLDNLFLLYGDVAVID